MSRNLKRLAFALVVALAIGVGLAVGVYLAGGATLSNSNSSPDRRERLDFYHATRWQELWISADSPGFVRLVRLAGDETLSTSPPFEMSGSGEVSWDERGVHVGSTASFDRRTGRWTMDE